MKILRIFLLICLLACLMIMNVKAAGLGGNNKHLSEAGNIKEAMKIADKHKISYSTMKVESTSYAKFAIENGQVVKIAGDYTYSGNLFIPGFSIAVDKNQIPFGSILFIEGYGWGMASDKGKAITWGIIDVSYYWEHHSLKWERRNVKVINFGKHNFSKDQIDNLIKIKKKYINSISKIDALVEYGK